jgi:hypothetical protein
MRAPALSAVLLLAFVGALSASAACSNQGEGEFCSTANGNNDCQDGLQCMAAPGLPPSLVNADRCCPIPPAQPTTAACSLNTTAELEASTEVGDVIAAPEGGDATTSDAVSAAEGGPPEASAPDAKAAEASAPEGSAPEGAAPDAPGPDTGSADASPE